jgi:hypothetical protein
MPRKYINDLADYSSCTIIGRLMPNDVHERIYAIAKNKF